MAPEQKRRRAPPRRNVASATTSKETVAASENSSAVLVSQPSEYALKEAKQCAITQAQQEGSKGNFRICDSSYENFLVPVVPTRAELAGRSSSATNLAAVSNPNNSSISPRIVCISGIFSSPPCSQITLDSSSM